MKSSISAITSMALLAAMSGIAGLPLTPAQAGVSVSTSQQSPTKNAPAPQDQQRRTAAVRRMSGVGLTRRDLFGGGPGWTNKHVQRMAKKKRNVKRSRK
jgi:hypothetical protein